MSPGSQRKPVEETAAAHKPFRCVCGSLLARLVPQGVELKCRRCKRCVIVPLPADGSEIEIQI